MNGIRDLIGRDIIVMYCYFSSPKQIIGFITNVLFRCYHLFLKILASCSK